MASIVGGLRPIRSDDGNRVKCQHHGVSIEEIEQAPSVIRFVVDDPSPIEGFTVASALTE